MPDPTTPTPAPAAVSQPTPGETTQEPPSPAAAPGVDSGAAAEPQKPTSKDRVAMARERLRLKSERLKAKQAQTEGKAAAEKLSQELDAARKRADEYERTLKEYDEDPLNVAAKRGRKPDDAIRGFLKSDDPNAQAIARAEAAERKAKELEDRLNREAEERRAAEQKARDEQQAQLEGQAIANFVKQVTADAKKYPYLNYMHTPQEIARETRALHEWAKKEGHQYSYDEVASYFDNRAKTRYEQQEARKRDLFPTESAPELAKGKAGQATRAAASVPKIGQATAPAARERPRAAQARLTRDEQAEEDIRLLREASARDRAAAEAQARKH